MVDFKKYMNGENVPWWARVKKPEQTERRHKYKPESESEPEPFLEPDLNDNDIDAVVKLIEARFQEINSIVKEHSIMPRGAVAARNGLNFLKTEHLTTDKQIFIIRWAGTHEDAGMQNKYNAELLCKVEKKNGGAKWLLSLNSDSPVLKVLDEKLGHDETQWKDKEVYLFNEVHPVTEAKYMRVEIVPLPA